MIGRRVNHLLPRCRNPHKKIHHFGVKMRAKQDPCDASSIIQYARYGLRYFNEL